ncbi:protein activator of alkane oxidation PraB [Caulobacter sp. CCNWLY153]|uniref:Protein activator of alkane oxidation PraB n=1 Tax=Caulobacter radicis TaxID=2172650 RepID=A0A2T9IXA8_9CAUL|nr:protein activator of alkane oxidation PraB [Caulobacter radicis]PVM71673.1 protein activator of alkane oxidation PraB [Caulobacter radicis]
MSKNTLILRAVALAAAIAGAAAPGVGSAATFNPPATEIRLTGRLMFEQAGWVSCDVTLYGYVTSAGHYAHIINGDFGYGPDWQCGWLVTPSGFPWIIAPTSSNTVSISGVSLNTILGNCSGTVNANWQNGPPSAIPLMYATIPGSPGVCAITGTLEVSHSVTLIP